MRIQGDGVIADLPLKTPNQADAAALVAAELASLVQSQLEHAVDGERRGLKVYESLYNLNEVIGTQYGDRVLYELIQNAHDAHSAGERGTISVRLVVHSKTEGVLYIANGGTGFRRKDAAFHSRSARAMASSRRLSCGNIIGSLLQKCRFICVINGVSFCVIHALL